MEKKKNFPFQIPDPPQAPINYQKKKPQSNTLQ